MLTNLTELRQYRDTHYSLLAPVKDDKRWGFILPWSVFIHGVSMLNPQQYGFRIQQRATEDFGWSPISMFSDAGDAGDRCGAYYEIKSSIVGHNGVANLVQIRPWHNVQTALLVFDLRNGYEPYLFVLSKTELERECALMGAAAAHGTKTANAHNENVEYRLSIKVDPANPHFARWCRLYRRTGTVIDH